MKQYLELLETIKNKGTYKPPAREGMPGSLSLFGYQFRHNLKDGFPILTTKKIYWKGVVTELLWFLRGDTNIKYLVDNGVNIWNEDAYNYYKKVATNPLLENVGRNIYHYNTPERLYTFEEFIEVIKNETYEQLKTASSYNGYTLGDCGYQYGKVWRDWEGKAAIGSTTFEIYRERIDQIKNVITSLRNTPESRRHIVTAIDPAHQNDLALYWCHALFQFNCRPLTDEQRFEWIYENKRESIDWNDDWEHTSTYSRQYGMIPKDTIENAPKYYLDCQLYQRSADVFLGVPFNIASYALLTAIIAKICNMIPGEFIHTFGDVHIYYNHMHAVNEQLTRTPTELPKLIINDPIDGDWSFENMISSTGIEIQDFKLEGYNPQPAIKAKLSTGLK